MRCPVAVTQYSTVSGDQRIAAVLAAGYELLVADRQTIGAHPAVIYAGNLAGRDTRALTMPILGLLAYDLPAALAEMAALVPTALVDSSVTITVGEYGKGYEPTDITRFTDSRGVFSLPSMMQDAMISAQMAHTNAIANLVDNFANELAGYSGIDLDAAGFLTAIGGLEVSAQRAISAGSALGVLHPVQIADLRRDVALATGGAVQWMPEAAGRVAIHGTGYVGQFAGVDLFSSPQVPLANADADRAGGIFLRGAIAWIEVAPMAEGADQAVLPGNVLFERARSADGRTTQFLSTFHRGYSEVLDTLGHTIETDA